MAYALDPNMFVECLPSNSGSFMCQQYSTMYPIYNQKIQMIGESSKEHMQTL